MSEMKHAMGLVAAVLWLALSGIAQADCTAGAKKPAWAAQVPEVRFGFTTPETSTAARTGFSQFTDFMCRKLGIPAKVFNASDYNGVAQAMFANQIDVALVGPSNYAMMWTQTKGKVEPILTNLEIDGSKGYFSVLFVKASSPFRTVADLKGRKVAHTSPSSNSGHLAPLALLPAQGLAPGKDYEIRFSGKHDQSVLGVNSGDYDAAHVASDVFDRMADRGQVKEADFRVIYRSQRFPTSSFAYAHDLAPALAQQIVKCFTDYRFPDSMKKDFDGADRFVPISYQKEWAVVREVDKVAAEQAKK